MFWSKIKGLGEPEVNAEFLPCHDQVLVQPGRDTRCKDHLPMLANPPIRFFEIRSAGRAGILI